MTKPKSFKPFLDLIFCLLAVLIAIIALLNIEEESEAEAIQQRAIYQIVMEWNMDNDIDLWAADPKNRIVGYRDKEGRSGSLMSLAHDCRGTFNNSDQLESFQEIIAIRGTYSGRYIVNGHFFEKETGYEYGDDEYKYYDSSASPTPVTVKLIQLIPFKILAEKELLFELEGEEKTFFIFELDEDGKFFDVEYGYDILFSEEI